MACEAYRGATVRMLRCMPSRRARFSSRGKAALLLVAIAFFLTAMGCVRFAWADEIGSVDVSLFQGEPSANKSFSVSGMLPGDKQTTKSVIEVSHRDELTVWFELSLTEDDGRLADALRVRIVDLPTGELVCEGTVRQLDVQDVLGISVPATATGTSTLQWLVEVSLPTSAGNEYQASRCVFDLHWYIQTEDEGKLVPLSQTGDAVWLLVVAIVVLIVCGGVALLVSACCRQSRAVAVATSCSPSLLGMPEGPNNIAPPRVITAGQSDIPKRSAGILAGLAVLAMVLVVVLIAWAVVRSHVVLPNHTFETATVGVDLNSGKPVFDGGVFAEPGRAIVEDFTVTNTGTVSCYVRVYADNIQGLLAPSLEISISDKASGSVLYKGDLLALESKTACMTFDALEPGQTQVFTATVRMSEDSSDSYQGKGVSFDLRADATQVRNNEGREF
ncbi:hypothetical protein [Adlercreutzia sp. ZJ138]|uniref:hypothetical protein n=1 Tax=Adlercreutzia sp. ZJ138 TaxID=2709405 RepID=UPI0013ED33A1|nr:hypothetical protein [Adlercreutzia sp. ZJ138]